MDVAAVKAVRNFLEEADKTGSDMTQFVLKVEGGVRGDDIELDEGYFVVSERDLCGNLPEMRPPITF